MSVFGQVTTGVTLFGPERFLNTEDVSETRQARLEVQLGTLREVRLLAVVVKREEGRATLDLGLDHARRGDFEEAEVGVRLAERGQERGADFEDGRGVLATDDEVTRVGEQGRVRFLKTRIMGDEQARSCRPRAPSRRRRTSLTLLRNASSPPGALPTTANQSAVSSWLSGAVLPSGSWLMTPVI